MHCVQNDCEYCVGKYKSFDPGAGWLSSLISSLFLLRTKRLVRSHSTNVLNILILTCKVLSSCRVGRSLLLKQLLEKWLKLQASTLLGCNLL